LDGKIKENGLDGACKEHRRDQKCLQSVVGHPEKSIPLGICTMREDNIKVDLREIYWDV
jgi:hypothetical protein